MERQQESKLSEAAAKGSVNSLLNLLHDDPLILDRVHVDSRFSQTPLHVAAMLGHVDFVKEITRIKPRLVNELDSLRSSPLHLAAAKGHLDVVKALLSVDRRTCLYRDRNGLTPLHLAALKGRIEVMKILLQAKPEAVEPLQVMNILHLCVKYYQLEPLKLLVKSIGNPVFINSRDSAGNTVLHVAVEDKQVETIKFLVTLGALEVNALNHKGMTAVDVLNGSRSELRDSEIEESLKLSGGIGALVNNMTPHINCKKNKNSWKRLMKQQDEWLEKKKSSLMIVASLIATMAFQVGVNPPSGVWQDTSNSVDSEGADTSHKAGYSVLAYNYHNSYIRFYMYNTVGLIASLSIILLLVSGLPMRRRLFMWILMVITWVAITAVALTYVVAVAVVTPQDELLIVSTLIGFAVIVWACLMALLLIAHTIRLFLKLAKRLTKALRRRSAN